MLRYALTYFVGPLCCLLLLCASSSAGDNRPRCIEPDDDSGSSAAVIVGDRALVHTHQILPVDRNSVIAAKQPAAQVEQVLDNLDTALGKAGSGLGHAVKINFYVLRREIIADVRDALKRRFRGAHKPAVSFVVSRLPRPAAIVAADAVATTSCDPGRAVKLVPSSGSQNQRKSLAAIIPGGTRIYISGQAARDKSLREATRKTLEGLRKTLRFLGRRDKDIVQLKAFLTPMADVADVESEITAFFGKRPAPPVVFVEWKSGSTVPIEIELIAWGGKNRTGEVVEFLTPPGMKASPVFSRVARINHSRSVYVSGLYASAADGDQSDDATGQREVTQIFTILERILKKAGSDMRHLVKATYYVSTKTASSKLNELRPKIYDPLRPPAASKAVVTGVGESGRGLTLDMIAVPAFNDNHTEYGPPEYGHRLSAKDAAAGWISLFDGRTTFGWKGAGIKARQLSGGETTTEFGNCQLRAHVVRGGTITVGDRELKVPTGDWTLAETSSTSGTIATIRLGAGVRVSRFAVRPLGLKPLFNGRDMTGWKRIDRLSIPQKKRPTWQIADGILRATGGPGCVEYRDGRFGDLAMQLDTRTRVRHANGGIFFRAIPGDFMNGYEVQVFNRSENGDPRRPAKWSTGGIDDRQNARRMVSRDRRFFRTTIIARGPHIATWVNGYQQTDFTDTRPAHANPRQGLRIEAGAIQLQAHDPETDVEFKNISAMAW